jgi:hemolysin III
MSDHIDQVNDSAPVKPKLRGVIHQYFFFVSLISGPLMVWRTVDSEQQVATTIYSLSLSLLLGTSALYHRITWSEMSRLWMRRLDHLMIFVLIAGTYTPLMFIGVEPDLCELVLKIVWGAVGVGAIIKLGWPTAPKWLSAVLYVALGWFALVPVPQLLDHCGWSCVGWLLAGGVLYTLGALAYAFKRPNFVRGAFGYHELFHTFVVIAAACHYQAIAVVSW